ncbi:phage tail protein [Salinisphaera sp. USBA-960]|nr:phage tail protein [Salifodinibacter halophilus]NNC25301.1 phage tail protein [Salifodinibacter halophilus]
MANEYYTVLTNMGLNKQAAYLAGEAPKIELATVHVGTGGGATYYDDYDRASLEGLTDLVAEVWSSGINTLSTDPQNPNWLIAEGVIPTSDGGWMIREVGIKDSAGDLIAVGRFPPTYKPDLSDGAAQDLVIRSITEWGNAGAVTLDIDPGVVLAPRSYVDTEVADAKTHAETYTDQRIDPVDRATNQQYRVVIVDGAIGLEEVT